MIIRLSNKHSVGEYSASKQYPELPKQTLCAHPDGLDSVMIPIEDRLFDIRPYLVRNWGTGVFVAEYSTLLSGTVLSIIQE
jgi:hypothetical protein